MNIDPYKIEFSGSQIGYIISEKPKRSHDVIADIKQKIEKANTELSLLTDRAKVTKQKFLDAIKKYETEIESIKKSPNLVYISKTAQNACIEAWCRAHGRVVNLNTSAIEKGIKGEPYAIDMVSKLLKVPEEHKLRKNTNRKSNGWFNGECDVHFDLKQLTIDTKCKYSMASYEQEKLKDDVKKLEYWQGQTYMNLWGAKHHMVVSVLLNSHREVIEKEKLFERYKNGSLDEYGNETEQYQLACEQIERNHIFDLDLFLAQNIGFELHTPYLAWEHDMQSAKRVSVKVFDLDPNADALMKECVEVCRDWIAQNLAVDTDFSVLEQFIY